MYSRSIATTILLVLMLVSVRLGYSNIVILNCQPAVGNISENINISCSIKINSDPQNQDYEIYTVLLTKMGQKAPCFVYYKGTVTGDKRFKLPTKYAPSLMLNKITLSDEGEYEYKIDTDRGISTAKIKLSVSAPYNLNMSLWPVKIVPDHPVDLYCNASGGYPEATIQWFDAVNTNRTKDAVLHITKGNNGLFELSSKLSFRSFDPMWGDFRCVVSSRYREEMKLALHLPEEGLVKPEDHVDSNFKQILAPLVVIGSLIVGLLIVLIYTRRRHQQRNRRPSSVPILRGDPGANNINVEIGDHFDPLVS